MKYLLTIIILFIALWGCEPCDNCGQPLRSEPSVGVTFINLDSLSKVDTAISKVSDLKSSYSTLKTSITAKSRSNNDSINKYQDSVDTGADEYKMLLDQYLARRKVLSDSSKLLDTLTTKATAQATFLGKIRTIITTGKVKVDTILLIENGNFLTFEDSASKYYLPLLMEANETNFSIKIKEHVLSVRFTYTTREYVDEVQRLIKIQAENIEVTSEDSIQYPDDETKLYFYF